MIIIEPAILTRQKPVIHSCEQTFSCLMNKGFDRAHNGPVASVIHDPNTQHKKKTVFQEVYKHSYIMILLYFFGLQTDILIMGCANLLRYRSATTHRCFLTTETMPSAIYRLNIALYMDVISTKNRQTICIRARHSIESRVLIFDLYVDQHLTYRT
ncbi:MAG: hypothetical protein CMI01_12440 [Oceanospirillaceae bacterium]|nr:hypothetical protein [Oceanospirillaceae bacterium]